MPISGYRFLLKDVVDVLLEDENEELEVDGIYIAPPQVNIDSDEDSADEDEGGLSDDLTGRQLRADAEIDLRNRNRISNEEKLRGAHQPPQYSICMPTTIGLETILWHKITFFRKQIFSSTEICLQFSLLSLFIDEEVVQHLVTQSNQYVFLKTIPELEVNCWRVEMLFGKIL